MKRFMALLATTLVMALSATTVFADGSPVADNNPATTVSPEAETEIEKSGVTVTAGTKPSQTEANAAAKEIAANNTGKEVTNVKVALAIEIAPPVGVTPSVTKPLVVTIPVTLAEGQNAADVFNFFDAGDGAGEKWHKMNSKLENGKLTVEFTHLSPVMVITYTATPVSNNSNSGGWTPSYDDEATPATSPKTGVFPVAAITAGICLAGAAVCGKKVKFN